MSELYQDEVIILHVKKWQTADKLAVCFSREHGKVPFLAFGAQATRSRMGRLVQPFARLTSEFSSGRSVDRLRSCELLETAPRFSVMQLAYGSLAAEALDQLTEDRDPREELYWLSVNLMHQLALHNPRLMTDAFLAQLFVAAGIGPVHHRCVICGRLLTEDARFSVEQGGALCYDCVAGADLLMLHTEAQELWGRLEKLQLAAPQPFAVYGGALTELERIFHRFIVYQTGKALRSLQFLRQLQSQQTRDGLRSEN